MPYCLTLLGVTRSAASFDDGFMGDVSKKVWKIVCKQNCMQAVQADLQHTWAESANECCWQKTIKESCLNIMRAEAEKG